MLFSVRTPRRADSGGPAVRPQRGRGQRQSSPRQTHTPRTTRSGKTRWVSAFLMLLLIGGGIFLFTNPMFYVTRVEIGGVRYVPAEEIFTSTGIAGYHILWVEPDVVEEKVASSPSLSSAQVIVQWPARVVILVQEREPALEWEEKGVAYWVDVNGNLMLKRRDLPNLIRVINVGDEIPIMCPGPLCLTEDTVSIDPAVILGAQQLKTLRPEIDVLYYDSARGLGYDDARGWQGYFGVGTEMVFRLQVYEQIIGSLQARGIVPALIDVSNPQSPYYIRKQ